MKKKIWDIYAPLYERFIPDVEKLGFIPGFVQTPWMVSGIGFLYWRK